MGVGEMGVGEMALTHSRHNPVRSKDEMLKLDYAKEVKYVQRNGTPGLTFRRGKTNHSYQWIPIVPGAQLLQELELSLKSRNPVYCIPVLSSSLIGQTVACGVILKIIHSFMHTRA